MVRGQFRAVCMKHKWELEPAYNEAFGPDQGNVVALFRFNDGTYSWDLTYFACPYWSMFTGGKTSEEQQDEVACNDRWYIVDSAGVPIYQEWHSSDKSIFQAIDPFKDWRTNLKFVVYS